MRSLGFAALVAALLVGCGGREIDRTPVRGSWIGEIEAVGDHGHSGFTTASLLSAGGTRVNVTLTGGSMGGRHPWRVRTGACGSGGEVIGDPEAYPPMEPNARGNASATATIGVDLDPDSEYHVTLHTSPEDLDTIVGCGELQGTS